MKVASVARLSIAEGAKTLGGPPSLSRRPELAIASIGVLKASKMSTPNTHLVWN
jgi:hypothetical protein